MKISLGMDMLRLETKTSDDFYLLGRIALKFKVSAYDDNRAYGDNQKHIELDLKEVVKKLAE